MSAVANEVCYTSIQPLVNLVGREPVRRLDHLDLPRPGAFETDRTSDLPVLVNDILRASDPPRLILPAIENVCCRNPPYFYLANQSVNE
jgi:hypothetical protein